MDQRIASLLGYLGTVAAAVLAAVLMSGQTRAEGPIDILPPFAGNLARAEVQAEVPAMTAEDSGSSAMAQASARRPWTTVASGVPR